MHAAPAPRSAAPALPTEDPAQAIAQVLLEGFNRHYALFRECARAAKRYFEAGNWLAIHHVAHDRIDFYDRRCAETAERIEREFRSAGLDGTAPTRCGTRVKLHFIGLLIDHRQPECAETFFNTVSCKILHRTYFHNRFLFVRPAASTEYLDADAPSYRCYYPEQRRTAACADRPHARPSARAALRRLPPRLALRPARHAPAPGPAVRRRGEFPDPGAVVAVLPQPDRVRRRARS